MKKILGTLIFAIILFVIQGHSNNFRNQDFYHPLMNAKCDLHLFETEDCENENRCNPLLFAAEYAVDEGLTWLNDGGIDILADKFDATPEGRQRAKELAQMGREGFDEYKKYTSFKNVFKATKSLFKDGPKVLAGLFKKRLTKSKIVEGKITPNSSLTILLSAAFKSHSVS